MRLNPFAPKDDPMYESLFCFGGPSDSGGAGGSAGDFEGTNFGGDTATAGGSLSGGQDSGPGGSNASGDPSEESTVDFSGGFDPGFDEGDTGDTGVSSAVAGSFGGGDGGAGAAGPSLIDSYLSGPMIADISTPMVGGSFVDPTTGRGIMADIPSMDYGSITGLANVVDPGFDQDSLLGQIAPESAGGEKFDYSDQDIFGDLTEEQLQQQAYVSGLKAGSPAAMITSQVQAPPTLIAEPEFVQPGGPGTRGLALAVGDQAKRGVDAAQDYMDALQAANRERIASGGTRDVSTTIDPMDMLDPFGDGFMTDEQRAASDAEIAATNARIDALRGASPVEQITRQATDPGQPVSTAEIQNQIASAGSAGTRPSTVEGQSVLSVGLGPNKQEFTFDNTVPGDQRTYTQISGPPLSDLDVFSEPADQRAREQQERAAAAAAVAAEGLPTAGSPVQQVTRQATDPATSFASTSNLSLADASTMAAMEDEVVQGLGSLAAAQEPSNFNFSRDVLGVDQSIPQMSLAPESMPSQFDRQMRMGEVQGPMSMARVEDTRFSGEDMMRQADDVLGQRAIDEAIFGDTSEIALPTLRAGAEIINALETAVGANQAQKIADVANRPGGALVRDPQTGEVLGAVGPESNLSSAIFGANDAVYVGDPRGYQRGVEIGTSILGPDTNVRDVGTQDPFTGELEGRPGADYTNQGPTDTGGGDGGGQPIIPPPEEVVAPPQDYQGRDIVSGYQYQPRGPISYAYTGLPSLAPQRLRPSFQARGQYAPLFPMGNYRRS